MMNDKEFAELELRAAVCPRQCQWPKPDNILWQKLHAAANEARARVSIAHTEMDEIDRNAVLSEGDKYCRRIEVANEAIGHFEASKTLARAREAVPYDASPGTTKALEEAEVGWNRAMNKIAERAGRATGANMRR
jgi:hypothetical protein